MTQTSETDEFRPALTRMTVNLIPAAAEALEHAAAMTRMSKTDALNRALQVYDFFLTQQAEGATVLIRPADSSEQERIRFL